MSTKHQNTEFPYEEIRMPSGDFWPSVAAAQQAGYSLNQIWSVTECDDVICYGPSHHYVNLLGYTVTEEEHDGDTYFEEAFDNDG